jgi:hypothetical protein
MKIIKYLKEKYYDLLDWWYYYQRNKEEQALNNAVMYCYNQMYKNATPSANFKELLKNAKLNARGEKIINYMDYYLPSNKIEEIIEKSIKKYKLSEHKEYGFRLSILLGVSPTSFKKNERK